MKKSMILAILFIFALSISSCEKENEPEELKLTSIEQMDLLFLLDEEKLARDVYTFFDDLYDIQQFSNIRQSEQRHMDYVTNLLDDYDVQYTIQDAGKFNYTELQSLYDQFIIDGAIDKKDAFNIGAQIEDLDIFDLENYKANSENEDVLEVYRKLQCGSENHMRAFVSALKLLDGTFTPTYLSQEDYDEIIAGENKHCD